MWTGILLFSLRLGARRQIHCRLKSDETDENLNKVLGMVELPHGDTVEDCFARVMVEQVEMVRVQMIDQLIRMKALGKYRLLDTYYMIAADASGVLTFKERHCEQCLERKHKSGKITYYHPVLEVKLVTNNGFALSIGTEFIENPIGWNESEQMKQDCELKAFYRLAKKLKTHFPRLPVCLLLDGLYACAPVFKICEDNKWKYIVVLKDDDLPSVTREFKSLCEITPQTSHCFKQDQATYLYRWINDIEYKTRETSTTRSYLLNVLDQVEVNTKKQKKHFRWVTNIMIDKDNVHSIAMGGRLRWKIENEGFNTQKKGGYNLEHCYAENPNSAKVFYLLLQIACIIMRLIELGSLTKKYFPDLLGSFKNIAAKLTDAFLYAHISKTEVNSWSQRRVQIRFNDSS